MADGVKEEGAAESSGNRSEGERRDEEREYTLAGVVRDMAVGALVGALVGAAWRVARTFQPEGADAVKTNVTGAAREIGAAAGAAVREVVASKPVNELIAAKGEDGKRAELMKSTLKEAVAAAGDAAKGVLESKGGGRSPRRDD